MRGECQARRRPAVAAEATPPGAGLRAGCNPAQAQGLLAVAAEDNACRNASLETEDQIAFARYIADEVSSGAAHDCADTDSRRALCRMRTLKIAAASQPSFTFDGGVGLATTNGRGNPSWDTIARTIDR